VGTPTTQTATAQAATRSRPITMARAPPAEGLGDGIRELPPAVDAKKLVSPSTKAIIVPLGRATGHNRGAPSAY
jgi:hypothetical protein